METVSNGVRKPRTEYRVARERFCAVWQAAQSLQEVCDRLGMPPEAAMSRANQYRRAGCPLKKFQGGRRKSQPTPTAPQASDAELGRLLGEVRIEQLTPEGERLRVLREILLELAEMAEAVEAGPKKKD